MPHVTVNQAQHKLSQLIRKVLAGEEVVIVRGEIPLVRLVPFHNGKTERKIGADKGLVEIAEHWCGLYKTPTNDGNIFWLCDKHRAEYKVN